MAEFRILHDIVQQTIEVLENPISSYEIDGIVLRLDYVARTVVNIDSGFSEIEEIVRLLGETVVHLNNIDSESPASLFAFETVPRIHSGRPGRPSFEIKEEQLSMLLEQSFQVPVIAQLLKVSTRTIERRMAKYGLSVSGTKNLEAI